MARVVAIGEVMVELGLRGAGEARLAYAGDTFNTAVYLSRLGCGVAYATALGTDDPFTAAVLALMREEGLDASLVARVPDRLPGLYAIERDENGERRFFYWRREAAVRDFAKAADLAALTSAAKAADLVYLSGITLAVVGEAGRAALAAGLKGAAVALDANYRPALWDDAGAAAAALEAMAPGCRFVSAGEEELAVLGLSDAPERWAAAGAEVVLRAEDRSLTILAPDEAPVRLEPGEVVRPLDTTGAGDSFNAGYLAARLAGRDPREAVEAGRRLARVVVQHLGAVIPRQAMPQ